MKKLIITMLALMLCLSLAACGRRNSDTDPTPSTNSPTDEMPYIPNPDPMPEANIPDPDVDTQMPIYDNENPNDHAANSRSGR